MGSRVQLCAGSSTNCSIMTKRYGLPKRIAELGGYDVLQTASDHLQLDVVVDGLENIPRYGGCMLVGNHPTGIADGIAMFDMLRDRRNDMVFFRQQ